jgi:autotransporter-associated beta strand protein
MKYFVSPINKASHAGKSLASAAMRMSLSVLAAMAAFAGSARATTDTWTGGSSAVWNTANNWSSSAIPANGDTALFNASSATVNGNTSVTFSGATTINSITFDTSAAAYTIGASAGSTLSLQNGGTIQTTSAVASIETVNEPISLSLGAYTFSSNSSTPADVLDFGTGATITNGAATSGTLTINGSNSGPNTIAGIISNNSTTHLTAIDKEGSGTWVLTGASTFTGGVTIGGGTLSVESNNKGLGNNGNGENVNLTNSGATLDAEINNVFINTLTGVAGSIITNNGAGGVNVNLAQGGSSTFNGNFTNGTSTVGISKSGGGDITLTGASTFTGGYTASDTSVTFVGGNNSIPSNAVNATIITSLGNTGATSALGWGALDFESNSVLIYDTPGTNPGSTSQSFGWGNSGGANLEIDNDSSSPLATLSLSTLGGGSASNNNTTQNLWLGGTNTGINVISSSLVNGSGAALDKGGSITTLTKANAGTWELSGSNIYGGGTSILAGTLMLGSSTVTGNFPNGSSATGGPLGSGVGSVGSGVLTGTNFNGATVSSGAVIDLNGQTISQAIVLNGSGISGAGALINSSNTAATISGGGLTGLQLTATGSGYSSAPTITLSGGGATTQATASATMGLTAASVIVTNAGSYTVAPTVTISGGGTNASGAKATVNISGGVITGITITSAGSDYTSAPTFTLSGGTGSGGFLTGDATGFTVVGLTALTAGSGYTSAPTVTFGSGAATATAYTSGVILGANSSIGGTGNITINGPVTDGGSGYSLTKVGSNTLKLGGVSTYSGATNVNAGILLVSGSISGTSAVNVSSGAELNVTGLIPSTANLAVSGTLAGTGSIGGNVNLTSGVIAPGTPGSTLAIGGSVGLDSASEFLFTLGTTGTTYDSVTLKSGSSITLASGATLQLQESNNIASTFAAGTVLDLFNVTGGSTFDFINSPFTYNLPALAPGLQWSDANLYSEGQLDVVTAAVPEPATWATVLAGFAALLVFQRRRKIS